MEQYREASFATDVQSKNRYCNAAGANLWLLLSKSLEGIDNETCR